MKVVTSPLLNKAAGVRHAFFSRHGGVSTGFYESLNVGRGSKDDPADVLENRRRCAGHFGMAADQLLTCYQIHSTTVLTADQVWGDERPQADGVVTARPGLVCGALSADCAPILLADPIAGVVGAAHAGWKGALDGMAESVVTAMTALGCEPHRLVVAIGPCIGPRSYEVGPEYVGRFTDAHRDNRRFFASGRQPGKSLFDLPSYVLSRLAAAGVTQAEWVGIDTCADEDFFSNRRAVLRGEPDYGRLLSAITLEERG
jgi:YfiH family protein